MNHSVGSPGEIIYIIILYIILYIYASDATADYHLILQSWLGRKVVEVLLGRTFKLYYTMLQQLLEHFFVLRVVTNFLDVRKVLISFQCQKTTTFALKIRK